MFRLQQLIEHENIKAKQQLSLHLTSIAIGFLNQYSKNIMLSMTYNSTKSIVKTTKKFLILLKFINKQKNPKQYYLQVKQRSKEV